MTTKSERKYASFAHRLDLKAFYEAIGFEVLRQATNKRGEPEDIGHCPDPWGLHKHGDTTGKFAINPAEKVYNCWVCGGGNLLSLAMAVNQQTEQEAEEWLYQFTGVSEVSDNDFLSEIDAILYQERIQTPPLPWFNERVIQPYRDHLGQAEGWLKDRGISMEVAHQAKLGYDGQSTRMAPVIKQRPKPYVGPSVYFPHYWGERLVGWQQRWLDPDRPKWIPKYTNTSAFPKVETLYGFEDVYLAQQPVVVVESVPTRLFLTTLGYPAVATFGASVTEEQMRLLRRFTQGVVLAPDNDQPGYKWLDYTGEEKRRQKLDRAILAQYLARFVPVKVIDPVGDTESGNDLGDLLDEGLQFAAKAVRVLYDEAQYY